MGFHRREPATKNWPELEAERAGAGKVKQETKILVIIGNPPYNAYAGVSPEEEQGLVEPYKEGLIADWGIKKFNLDDLYVRFFRIAERKIAERTGQGIVCFISNFSYLADPSFVVMRRRFLMNSTRSGSIASTVTAGKPASLRRRASRTRPCSPPTLTARASASEPPSA